MDSFGEIAEVKQLQDRILHAVYGGRNFSGRVNSEKNDLNEVQCPKTIVRKRQGTNGP